MDMDQMFAEAARKNVEGTLTVGDTIMFGYYRLLEGEHAGRVIIKTHSKIDEKSICYFANGLTWIYTEKLKDIRCESAYPQFNDPIYSEVDRSESTWYTDGPNSRPMHHVW